jgi:hypothetical protein
MAQEALAEPRRREIFRMLVSAQDMDMGVNESREFVSYRYGLSECEMRRIEEEGVRENWPPL